MKRDETHSGLQFICYTCRADGGSDGITAVAAVPGNSNVDVPSHEPTGNEAKSEIAYTAIHTAHR